MTMAVWTSQDEDEEIADIQRGKLEIARGIFCGLVFSAVMFAFIFLMACL